MCGIFGMTVDTTAGERSGLLRSVFDSLVLLSESRGKEASGIAVRLADSIEVRKSNMRGSRFIRTKIYRDLMVRALGMGPVADTSIAIIGHTRLVTNGSMEIYENNQPVVRDGLVGIHNGIIVNHDDIFARIGLSRTSAVDTEALLALIRHYRSVGKSMKQAVEHALGEIKGEASVAILADDSPELTLATNNGSLYYCPYAHGILFASERYILEQVVKAHPGLHVSREKIIKMPPGSLRTIFLSSKHGDRTVPIVVDEKPSMVPVAQDAPSKLDPMITSEYQRIFDETSRTIEQLRRCTRCILPETMPFITFDEEGVCSYCHHYVKKKLLGESALKKIAEDIRRTPGEPNCIFPFSGGRDSSYGLHYVKEVLGLEPIAYSYDWGMVTDLGRRNQARMCGALGVEHLWLSADIVKKRQNIRKNVLAWLAKPNIATIPLFMAGDKQYFYYLNKLRKQLRLVPIFYCENFLEKTDFKFGFCGIPPKFGISHVYRLGIMRKLALALYYAKAFIKNPRFLNASILDTIGAYISTYFIPHDYIFLYDYVPWDEVHIDKTLIETYDWEVSPDTPTTWRIGDGTAAFYNYIYYSVAGFTENDTFRSNQIREGMLAREEALMLAARDNRPRFDSIKWYCDTIDIDFEQALGRIHSMPKLFKDVR